jgi:PAS domain S-box-containing protein
VDVTERREAQDALRVSEERLRRILEAATDYAIFTLDRLRRITSWSPGAEAAFGYAAHEVLGAPGDLLFTTDDRASGAPEQEAWDADGHGRAAGDRWYVRKDGGRFYASGVLTPFGPRGSLGYVKVLQDLTERKRAKDEVRGARDLLKDKVTESTAELVATLGSLEEEMARRREFARKLSTAQEDERQWVSQDLHDMLGQLMAGLSLALKAVETSSHLPPATAGKLADAQRVADSLGREVHALAVRRYMGSE